jgi:hypothetical protein
MPTHLGQRAHLVGGLEGAGQKSVLRVRLVSQPWVDERTTKVKQLTHLAQADGVHGRGMDHHVVVEELRGSFGVRHCP